jgi:hypothetical protein
MWKWLFDAHRLLGVTVEIIDDRLTLLTPPGTASRMRNDAEPLMAEAIEEAVAESLTTATPAVLTSGGCRVSCTPIVIGGSVAGAVLVGVEERRLGDQELARASLLLANAIEDELAHPSPEHGDSLHKISAFYQLLHAAIATGSDREVVRTFAEALSVWDDIEVFAYRADLEGHYTLDLTLPGSDRAASPHEIDARAFPVGGGLVPLSDHDREDLGFAGSVEAALVHLAADGGPWVIAMTAPEDPTKAERSELYVAALAHAMNAALGVETARLTWALMQQFVDGQSARDAAVRALNEIAAVLNAEGSLAVFGEDGTPILLLGECDPDAPPVSILAGRRLRAPINAPPPYVAALEMRSTGRPFTRRDARLFEAAVANFSTWLTSAIRRLDTAIERRVATRSFDQILDRYVQAAEATRDATSLLLLSTHSASVPSPTAQSWLRMVRPQLRPTDIAGRLTSGEVGVLLLRTPQLGAQVVARRLMRLLHAAPASAEPAVRIGVASHAGEGLSAAALIERARLQGDAPPTMAS